jgi:hypothetical protein
MLLDELERLYRADDWQVENFSRIVEDYGSIISLIKGINQDKKEYIEYTSISMN